MDQENDRARPATQEGSAQMRVQTNTNTIEDEHERSDATDTYGLYGFEDIDTSIQPRQYTKQSTTSVYMPAAFYNTSDTTYPTTTETSLLGENTPHLNNESSKIALLNFVITKVDASGHMIPERRALLRNITGFPVDLNEIRSIAALNSIVSTYFTLTLSYYGLIFPYISGYAATLHSRSTDTYSITLGPASTQESWRPIYSYLANRTPTQNHCIGQKCVDCSNPPRILVCFDETALCNAMISKGLHPGVDLEYLDGAAPVLNAKSNRSSSVLKAAYTQLRTDAINSPLCKALAIDSVSTAPTILASNASTTASLKRHADSDTDDAPKSKRRNDWGTETPPPLSTERVKASDWLKATPKPVGDTKASTDSCLTCIAQGRICKGTTITVNGKCYNCNGGETGKSKRKCYWADEDAGILTYDDARDADDKCRRLPKNNREHRALRNRSQTPSIAVQPTFTTALIRGTLTSFQNHFPTLPSPTFNPAIQYHTPSDFSSTMATPDINTTDGDSSADVMTVNEDDNDIHRYIDYDAFNRAHSHYTNNTLATNEQGEIELTSNNGTNEGNPFELDGTDGQM